jgi:hypothetical protein
MADAAEIRAGRIDLYCSSESKRRNAAVPGDVEHKRMAVQVKNWALAKPSAGPMLFAGGCYSHY